MQYAIETFGKYPNQDKANGVESGRLSAGVDTARRHFLANVSVNLTCCIERPDVYVPIHQHAHWSGSSAEAETGRKTIWQAISHVRNRELKTAHFHNF